MLRGGVLGQIAVTGSLQDTNQSYALPQIPQARGGKELLTDALSCLLLLKFIALFAFSFSPFSKLRALLIK